MRDYLSTLRRSERHRVHLLTGLLLVVCVVVAAVVAVRFTRAAAPSNAEHALNCLLTGPVAHTHNKDCYDERGELICPLPELAKHVHSDACYDENGTLTCTKVEITEEHVHDASCFAESASQTAGGEEAGFATDSPFTYGIVAVSPSGAPFLDQAVQLHVLNVDATTKEAVRGAHFALYGEMMNVTRGTTHKSYSPLMGYEDIVTNRHGMLPHFLIGSLRPGTYYLKETDVPEGYVRLSEDLCFTVGQDGMVEIASGGEDSWLTTTYTDDGATIYTLTIPNMSNKNVRIKKVSSGNSNALLSGAAFELYAAEDYDGQQKQLREGASPLVSGTTDDSGVLILGSLQVGDYVLIETKAPKGYKTLIEPVGIHIDTTITYMQSNNDKTASILTEEQSGATWYEIEVWNNPGIILPRSGGPGTAAYSVLGGLLMAIAAVALFLRHHTATEA